MKFKTLGFKKQRRIKGNGQTTVVGLVFAKIKHLKEILMKTKLAQTSFGDFKPHKETQT